MSSITKEGKAKVMLNFDNFMIDIHPSGACLLKVIIRESHVDASAMTLSIRSSLNCLGAIFMVGVDSGVEKLNDCMKKQVGGLAAHGKAPADLLPNLLKGHKAAQGKSFVTYFKRKEEGYEGGIEAAVEELVQKALLKHKAPVEKGIWKAPTESEECIIALEAELKKVKASCKATSQPAKGAGRQWRGGPKWRQEPTLPEQEQQEA